MTTYELEQGLNALRRDLVAVGAWTKKLLVEFTT